MRYRLHQIRGAPHQKHNGSGCADHLVAISCLHHDKRMVGYHNISPFSALMDFQQSSDYNAGRLRGYIRRAGQQGHCLAAAKQINNHAGKLAPVKSPSRVAPANASLTPMQQPAEAPGICASASSRLRGIYNFHGLCGSPLLIRGRRLPGRAG